MDQSVLNKARRDKFSMVFNIPNALKKKILGIQSSSACSADLRVFTEDHVQFAIYGTPVPKVTVGDIEAPYAGQVHKHTSYFRPSYSPLTIGLNVDNKFLNYWLLWSWLNLWNDTRTSQFDPEIYNPSLDTSIEDYVTTFSIYGLDEYNNRVVEFKYKNVIITELSEIEFSYRNTEEIGCTATFVFDQLYVNLLAPSC